MTTQDVRDPSTERTGAARGRLVVTLSPATADAVREMAAQMEVKVPEAVRRGLNLLRLRLSLGPGEHLMVRRANGELERVLLWPDE